MIEEIEYLLSRKAKDTDDIKLRRRLRDIFSSKENKETLLLLARRYKFMGDIYNDFDRGTRNVILYLLYCVFDIDFVTIDQNSDKNYGREQKYRDRKNEYNKRIGITGSRNGEEREQSKVWTS